MSIAPGIPRKHAHVAPAAVNRSRSGFGTFALAKDQLPCLSTVCSGKPDHMLSQFLGVRISTEQSVRSGKSTAIDTIYYVRHA